MDELIPALASGIESDTISSLEQAAELRYRDGERFRAEGAYLMAVYLYGYAAEMILGAAYFRSYGFGSSDPIARAVRRDRMKVARKVTEAGRSLMNDDPHHVPGWARFLSWQRRQVGPLPDDLGARLGEAVAAAEVVYRHWRPELRYKTLAVSQEQVLEVWRSVTWLLGQSGRL